MSAKVVAILPDRLQSVQALLLQSGAHDNPEAGMCVMEAVAYVAGEKFTDHPKCASPSIAAFMRSWNDRLPDKDRQLKSGKQAHEEKPKKGRDAKGKPAPSKKAAPAPTKAPTWPELQAYAKKHRVAPGSTATRQAVQALTPLQRKALIGDHHHGLVLVDGHGKPKKAAKATKAAKKPVIETAAVKKAREKLAAKTGVVAKMNPAKAGKAKGAQVQLSVAVAQRDVVAPKIEPGVAVPAKGAAVLEEHGILTEPAAPSATTQRLQALAAGRAPPAAAKETAEA